jgi:hypothetical protein
MGMDNAPFHRWMKESHTSRFRPVAATQCCCERTVKLLLAEEMIYDSVIYRGWFRECGTVKFLQEHIIQYCYEVMAEHWLVEEMILEDATFRFCPGLMVPHHTSGFLQVGLTPYCSEVMGLPWPAEKTMKGNATSHLWMKECRTTRSLRAMSIPCFSEVTAKLWLVE